MPGKTATKVPYRLTLETKPEVSVDLSRPLHLTVRGKKSRVIAHVRFTAKHVEILGSDESEPMQLPYQYLKKRGVDRLRGFVDETVRLG